MVILETVFPVNHLAGTSKTESNYKQIQLTQKNLNNLRKLQTYTKTKPNETKTWFRRLSRHPARKRSGSILQLPDPHGAQQTGKK